MKTKLFFCLTLAGIISLNSCKREDSTPQITNSVAKKTLTPEEKLLQLKLEQSAKIIAEVIKDKTILAELNQQIGEKLSITKSEESLTFKELFSEPSNVKVASSSASDPKVFTIAQSLTSKFKSKYLEIAETKSYDHPEKYKQLEVSSSMKTNAARMVDDMVNIEGAELYFPYSENFENTYYTPTITSHPIYNSESNYGIHYNDMTNSYDNVYVNEDYAYSNPTYIVTIDDGPSASEIASGRLENGSNLELIDIDESISSGPPPPPFINPSIIQGSRVYYGRFHLEYKAEGFLDGRSEITFMQPTISPSLNSDGTLNTAIASANLYYLGKIKRSKIGKMSRKSGETVWVGATFTDEWLPINSTLPLVIYEYDKGADVDIEIPAAKFKITVFGIPVEVTTPSKLKIKVPGKSYIYVNENVSRAFYGQYRKIKNPGINPGWYDEWRSWGGQKCNVTLITEGMWMNN